jgi:predicted DNA-binding transcriptional regulator AlpA
MTATAFLSLPEVTRRVNYQRASIYAMSRPSRGKDGKARPPLFPSPVKLGKGPRGRVGWIESDVEAWITAKIRGASDDELAALVAKLEAQRATAATAA